MSDLKDVYSLLDVVPVNPFGNSFGAVSRGPAKAAGSPLRYDRQRRKGPMSEV